MLPSQTAVIRSRMISISGFPRIGKQRLGQVVRDRPEPLAESGRGEKYVDRKFAHD